MPDENVRARQAENFGQRPSEVYLLRLGVLVQVKVTH